MQTLTQWEKKIWDSGRKIQDISRKEIIEGLDIISNDIFIGNSTISHGNTLLSIRYKLMTNSEKLIEQNNLQDQGLCKGT